MQMIGKIASSLLAMAACASLNAATTTIHFGPSVPSFDTDYDTAFLDFDASSTSQGDPYPWGAGYNDLPSAVWTDRANSLIFDLVPLGGETLTLNSFAMGNYLNAGGPTSYEVYDLSDLVTPLVSVLNFNIAYSTTTHPTYAVGLSSTTGFRLVVGPDAYNNGVNDIKYTIGTAVPDAGATASLLGLSAAALALFRRKS